MNYNKAQQKLLLDSKVLLLTMWGFTQPGFYQCRSTENAAWSRAVSVFEGDSANFGAMPPGVGKALSRYLVSGQSKRSRSCLEIDTTMGLALSDVSDAVNLGAEQTRQVLGKAAYQAVTLRQYWSIVPSLS